MQGCTGTGFSVIKPINQVGHLAPQPGHDERTTAACNCRDHLLRKSDLVQKGADFKAINQQKDGATFSGQSMRQAKSNSYEIFWRILFALKRFYKAAYQLIIAWRGPLQQVVKCERRLARSRIEGAVCDVLLQDVLKEASHDSGWINFAALKSKVNRDRFATPREQLIVGLSEQLCGAGVRRSSHQQQPGIAQQ